VNLFHFYILRFCNRH